MNQIFALLLILTILPFSARVNAQRATFPSLKQLQSPQTPRLGFIIHGGAGVITKGSLTPEKEQEFKDKLTEAVLAGYKALQAGKSSLDAIEIAIKILEDSLLFNAGKGAVFTNDGRNELDASIMFRKDQSAGAVVELRRVNNPITLARAVMEKSEHVMMVGEGAEKFADDHKIELVDPKYFWTQHRWDALQKILKEGADKKTVGQLTKDEPSNRFGTVGAVALDKNTNLAAGTSTGGMINKKCGRVGDAPIIGAGTYANNETCAVSATGWGEFFIRLSVARDICAQMEYRALPIQNAADFVIKQKLQKLGGDGGVVAMDRFGNIGISFNSEGMYRGYINIKGEPVVEIY